MALIRLEQLYPLPLNQIRQIIAKYSLAESVHWIQEEPVNMGAWKYISQNIGIPMYHTARPASGSPATGSGKLHKIQQELIVTKALGNCTCDKANGTCRLECGDETRPRANLIADLDARDGIRLVIVEHDPAL